MQPQATLEPSPDLSVALPGSAVLTAGLTACPHPLREISAQAADGLFKLRIAGLEIGGVLFGEFSAGRLIIREARPFEPQYAYGPSFQLSPSDCVRFRQLIASPAADPSLHGLAAVGYYLSRTRTEPVLAEHNAQLLDDYFPERWQIALAVKPHKLLPTRCVAYYRSASGDVLPSAEFTVDHRYAEPEVPVEATSPPEPAAVPTVAVLVPDVPKRAVRSRAWIWVSAAVVAVALASAAALGFWYNQPIPAPATVVVSPSPPVPVPTAPPEVDHANTLDTPPAKPPADPDAARVKELEKELAQLRMQLTRRPASPVPAPNRPPAQPSDSAPALSAPPHVEPANSSPAIPAALNKVAKLPAAVESPPAITPPPRAVHKPSAGRMLWTGSLHKSGLLFIEESGASSGALVGALPGRPVRITLESADLTQGGIVVYTSDPKRSGTSEAPGTTNGWNHTVFQYDPRRVGDLSVIEMPAPRNGWKKLVVRANRPVGLILVNWQETGADQ